MVFKQFYALHSISIFLFYIYWLVIKYIHLVSFETYYYTFLVCKDIIYFFSKRVKKPNLFNIQVKLNIIIKNSLTELMKYHFVKLFFKNIKYGAFKNLLSILL